jgi:EAL domain-containing protein (putative c-di-GMP-specific phosphodiesterase class I)
MDFIPLAETGNLIWPVTEWVLSAAARQCRRWQDAGLELGVSVNLSPRILREATLPGHIATLLDSHGLDPRRLTLEITEGSLLADPDHAIAVLTGLLELGLEISIDDFGTGYSSLSHLKKLPVSEIKIDRSFITDLTRNEHDEAIVRSIVELGHNLGCRIVAEGIEERETWLRLATLGCDLGQGYWISRPLAERPLIDWLRDGWSPPLS